ncbi:MAG: DUF2279 domain-containing protein [Candidatus Zixiibacteriota bacterium]|nr:MAG: DUF2279 domain-containing protein [candidate division Zixibacteria bacterium]
MKKIFLIFLIFLYGFSVIAQQNQKKILLKPSQVFVGEVVVYSGTMLGLNILWYKDYEHNSFHWFDDHNEWLQMDKLGHGFSAYYLTNISYSLFQRTRWAETNKSIIYGSLTAWTYISTVEVFDGFSSKWGASYSDLIANTIGTGLFTLQELKFGKQIIVPKFSFHQTPFAKYRTDALGENFLQNLLKDYNGQTYWLSVNFRDVFNRESFPCWLNFAFGYSATGMLGGKENPIDLPYFNSTRQYLFSLDVDFRKIPARSLFLKKWFRLINVLKVPFPTLILANRQIKFSTFYF